VNDFEDIKRKFTKNIKNLYQPTWGLCLGGGGMRGMAHIGVIKALEEKGLYPDMIAGTSAGSIIGAAYAIGVKADEMYDYFLGLSSKDIIKKNRRDIGKKSVIEFIEKIGEVRKHLTISFDGSILESVVHNLCGDKTFADTIVPLYVVATDIAHVKEIVFESGRLDAACRASSSIPGVFTPYCVDDKIIVDGFVLNNLPADVLKNKGADIVISVDLKAFGTSGAKSAKFSDVVSTTLDIMSNTSSIKGKLNSNLVIEPDLSEFSSYTLKDDNLKKMFELGYEAACKKMNDIAMLFIK